MRVIGLTGGIAMGKSTIAGMFRRAGVWVFDADRAVHALEGEGGRAVEAIGRAFPGAVTAGAVDRGALRALIAKNPARLTELEAILHPLVEAAERRFVCRARRARRALVVLDIPLLFETGGERRVDLAVVVSAPRAVQIARLQQRRKMQPGEVSAIIARQMPDREKRRRADVVVPTGLSRWHSARVVRRLIGELRGDEIGAARYRDDGARSPCRRSRDRDRCDRIAERSA